MRAAATEDTTIKITSKITIADTNFLFFLFPN